jgi:hypothetical protein
MKSIHPFREESICEIFDRGYLRNSPAIASRNRSDGMAATGRTSPACACIPAALPHSGSLPVTIRW